MNSIIEELPKILAQGKKEAQKILDGLSKSNRITLQTNEIILPSKETSSLLRGKIKEIGSKEWFNRMIYGDNLLAMQALLSGNGSIPSMRGKIDLIYIDPPFDSKADYRTKIHLSNGDIEKRPNVIEQFAYSDTWKNGTASYLQMLIPRLFLMRELLSEQGSIYVHIDWHVGHYVKVIMDEIFGKQNFRNEIIWWYYNKMQGNIGRFASNHDVIFSYKKGDKPFFKVIKELREQPKKQQVRFWDPKTQSLKNKRDEQGNPMYYDDTHRTIDDVWRMSYLVPADKTENLRFATQKPEKLIGRIIESSCPENGIVADFFSGSGTTGAVAEKLGRKWMMCDLGKPACMIMRKRLIDLDSKPFLFQSIGDYQKEQFEQSNYKTVGDLAHVVLNLYGALPFPQKDNIPNNIGYIKSDKTLVLVDSPKKMTGYNTLKKSQELRGSFLGGWKKVVVLGWNFVSDIGRVIDSLKDDRLEVLVIPPDLLDKLKTKASYEQLIKSGKIRFSSLQYLKVKPIVKKDYDKNNFEITVELDDYVLLSPDALPLEKEDKEKLEKMIAKDPLALIEYWSIDPDYDGEVFRSKWQDYRENDENEKDGLRVVKKAKLIIPKENKKRKICIKAVDVFGFESVDVKVI